MNNKHFLRSPVLITRVAARIFHDVGELPQPVRISQNNVDTEVTDIQAMQTNDAGETEYQLQAESITRDEQTHLDGIQGLQMDWQPSGEQAYELTAQRATMNQQTGNLQISGGFQLMGLLPNGEQHIVVVGDGLEGNSKDKLLTSHQPVKVSQGNHTFTAGTMQANLNTGEFEFGQIEVMFDPSPRQNKSLF